MSQTPAKSSEEVVEDFLEVDTPIPGQNFVCLSFVSPEKELAKKETYQVHRFLKSVASDYGLNESDIAEKYDEYLYQNRSTLEKEFFEENDFRTSVRGVKVRGTYDTYREAEVRAKLLQRKDKSFHVFVGQVGYWLPWDPCADDIEDQEYTEKHLNKLVKKYKDNQKKKAEYFEEQKKESMGRMKSETDKQKEALEVDDTTEATQELDGVTEDITETTVEVATEATTEATVEATTEAVSDATGGGIVGSKVDDTTGDMDLSKVTSKEVQKMIHDSLEKDDPWLQQKGLVSDSAAEKVLDLDQA